VPSVTLRLKCFVPRTSCKVIVSPGRKLDSTLVMSCELVMRCPFTPMITSPC